jgi:hypothetical protein
MTRYLRRLAGLALAGSMLVVAGMGATSPASASVSNSPGYFHFTSVDPGTCIDGQSAPPGTSLVMWRCLNTTFEEWRTQWADVSPQYYSHCNCTQARMYVNHATGMCMAAASDTQTDFTGVLQQTCNPGDPKQWWLFGSGTCSCGASLSSFLGRLWLRAPGDSADDGVPVQITNLDFTQTLWSNEIAQNQWEL